MIRSVICYFVFVLLHITVQVKSQVCRGIPQYDRCSTNGACGCLHMIGASDIGICGFLYTSCSELVSCQSPNNICYESDHICVHHPRCHLHPVCYPASMIDQQICPSMAMTNTTIATTIASTTTPKTTIQQWVPLRAPAVDIHPDARWAQNGVTVAGGNREGNGNNQLSTPYSLYVDDEQTVYVADYYNDRIMEWRSGATSGKVIAGGNGRGNRANQLYQPNDVIVDKESDSLIICDFSNNRVVRWPRRNGTSGETIISNILCVALTMDENGSLYVVDGGEHVVKRYGRGESKGTMVAGGSWFGDRLDQLKGPKLVFIDRDRSLYVSDSGNNRVIKWMEGASQGIIVAGGEYGNALTQLAYPYGVVVDQSGTVYVTDLQNDRIMRWPKGAAKGSVIAGGNGQGEQSNQLNRPSGLSFDRDGNLYVAEWGTNRVQKFNIEFNG